MTWVLGLFTLKRIPMEWTVKWETGPIPQPIQDAVIIAHWENYGLEILKTGTRAVKKVLWYSLI